MVKERARGAAVDWRRLHRDAVVDVAQVVQHGRRGVVVPPLPIDDELVLVAARLQVDGLRARGGGAEQGGSGASARRA